MTISMHGSFHGTEFKPHKDYVAKPRSEEDGGGYALYHKSNTSSEPDQIVRNPHEFQQKEFGKDVSYRMDGGHVFRQDENGVQQLTEEPKRSRLEKIGDVANTAMMPLMMAPDILPMLHIGGGSGGSGGGGGDGGGDGSGGGGGYGSGGGGQYYDPNSGGSYPAYPPGPGGGGYY